MVILKLLRDIEMAEAKPVICFMAICVEVICQNLIDIDDISTLAKEYNSQLLDCLDKHAPTLTKTHYLLMEDKL